MQWNMTLGLPQRSQEELDYPSSDGQPMAETSLHAEVMAESCLLLQRHFVARADVNVGMNLLFYYEKGNSGARFSPDVYVSIGAPKGPRRVYKMWEEPVPPTFVLEVSSRGTWLEDMGNKQALCAKLGVSEYFLFDPDADYLNPPLQGFRLQGKHYTAIPESADGLVRSDALGLDLRAELPMLRFSNPSTGEPLPFVLELDDALETERRLLETERRLLETERRLRAETEARLATAEAELARLRAKTD
jgi:Uma2 family endonuclease